MNTGWATRADQVKALVRAADERARAAQQERVAFITDARAAGLPWAEVGRLLGVSPQRVQQIAGSALSPDRTSDYGRSTGE